MPLFEVDHDTGRVTEIRPTTFPALRLWERQDLEAWVLSSPDLAGGDFTVVTSEFDRSDQTAERLDVLGVVALEPGRARLVVVELKRDGTSTTVDLQAIKYAAYVAACDFDDVVDMCTAVITTSTKHTPARHCLSCSAEARTSRRPSTTRRGSCSSPATSVPR